jgi:hypothetical protein
MEAGYLGVGAMGQPMAHKLLDAGHTLTIYDINEAAMRPLLERQARACKREIPHFGGSGFTAETDWLLEGTGFELVGPTSTLVPLTLVPTTENLCGVSFSQSGTEGLRRQKDAAAATRRA